MHTDVYFTLSLCRLLSDCILIALSLFEKSFVDFSISGLASFVVFIFSPLHLPHYKFVFFAADECFMCVRVVSVRVSVCF